MYINFNNALLWFFFQETKKISNVRILIEKAVVILLFLIVSDQPRLLMGSDFRLLLFVFLVVFIFFAMALCYELTCHFGISRISFYRYLHVELIPC